ncbi:hypothetical protein Tco_1259448 [Tanacetum coccineum]
MCILANIKDLEQIHEDDLEQMDLKWQLSLLSMRTRRFFQKTSRKITINGSDTVGYDKSKKKLLPKPVAIDGVGLDWSYMEDDEVPTNMALMAFSDSELEKLKQEKESNQLKIENFDNASKRLFSPPNLDLSYSGLEEFQQPKFEGYGPKTSKSVSEDISNEVRESPNAPLVEELVSNDKLEKKTIFPTVAKIEFVRPKQ